MATDKSNQIVDFHKKLSAGGDLVFYVSIDKIPSGTEKRSLDIHQMNFIKWSINDSQTNTLVIFYQDRDAKDGKSLDNLLEDANMLKFLELQTPDDVFKETAYNTIIRMGKYKGKSPAQVIMETGSTKELGVLYGMVTQNIQNQELAKYRQENEKLASALLEAANLYNAGRLKEPPKIKVLTDIMKTTEPGTKELQSGMQPNMRNVRQIKIEYAPIPGQNGNINIYISNCIAPAIENAQIGADMSRAANKKSLSFTITLDQYRDMLRDTIRVRNAYVMNSIVH